MLEARRKLRLCYERTPAAQEYFSFPVLVAALCEKHGLDRGAGALLSEKERDKLLCDAQKLLAGYPLQYYLGEAEFCERAFSVREGVLIPRPETELLARLAIELLPDEGVLYDFCCGSGCISISVLLEKPLSIAVAVDLSDTALACAEQNAGKHGVRERIVLRKRDLLREKAASKPADLLVMNPPYIRTELLDTLPENVKNEPRMALDGGADGLLFYRAILNRLPDYLKEGGTALFEIGCDQGAPVRDLCARHAYPCEILRDLENRDRIAKITLAKNRSI